MEKIKIDSVIGDIWGNMKYRCYSSWFHLKNPSYIGCSVDERWHNFQIFGEWCINNYIDGFALDKDILIKGNKVYSPETCCFVPLQINSLFVKTNKKRGNLPIGICLNANKNRYRVHIKKFGKQINCGTYDTIDEAFQAYKKAKELYIKQVAEIWKNKISPKVYQALINYQVEITD